MTHNETKGYQNYEDEYDESNYDCGTTQQDLDSAAASIKARVERKKREAEYLEKTGAKVGAGSTIKTEKEVTIKMCNFPSYFYIAYEEGSAASKEESAQTLGMWIISSGLNKEWLRKQGIIDWEFLTADDDEDIKVGRIYGHLRIKAYDAITKRVKGGQK